MFSFVPNPDCSARDQFGDSSVKFVSTYLVALKISGSQSRVSTRRSIPLSATIRTAATSHRGGHHSPFKKAQPAVSAPVLTISSLLRIIRSSATSLHFPVNILLVPCSKIPKRLVDKLLKRIFLHIIEPRLAPPPRTLLWRPFVSPLCLIYRWGMPLFRWITRPSPFQSLQHRLFSDAVPCLQFGVQYFQSDLGSLAFHQMNHQSLSCF